MEAIAVDDKGASLSAGRPLVTAHDVDRHIVGVSAIDLTN